MKQTYTLILFLFLSGQTITVTGSCSEGFADGNYIISLDINGRPSYVLNNGEFTILWSGTRWEHIDSNNNIGMFNPIDTPTPPASTLLPWTAERCDPTGVFSGDGTTTTCFVTIPDANFKQALIDLGYDTNDDEEISCDEATAVTGSINVINKDISNLTGIEAFVNITGLYCDNNSLESLDTSKNTALTDLGCDGNNLTVLDVSTNTALTDLWCYSNNLESLNIANGKNDFLNYFLAYNNANLTCIQVDDETNVGTSWEKDATASYSEDCGASLSLTDKTLNNSISIYPNPVTNALTIQLEDAIKEVVIYLHKVKKF